MIRYGDFSDLIDRMVASFPSQPAFLVDEGERDASAVSWARFGDRVRARADELACRGIACEAILADGTIDCVVEVFAAVSAGLQVALIDPLMPNPVAIPLMNAVDADGVWASNSTRQHEIEQALAPTRKPAYGAHGLLFFTSGTTSRSKPIMLTDESLMASAFNGGALLPLAPGDTLLCLLPLSHVFGFVCGVLWGLSCGATVALGRGPRFYASDFALFKPTAVSVVPKLLEFLVARDALNDELKLVLVGAADCPDSLLDRVRSRGIRASLGYGLTETSSGIALSLGDDFHAMTICPDDEVTIAEDGEVLVSAPTCLMRGYYRDERKTAAAVRNGVLHTGDLGFLDENGLLHIEGRKKDVLTLANGTKVFLPEYEAAVAQALGEHDVAVALHENKLTLVCGKLTNARTDEEITQEMAPVMAGYAPASRVARIVHLDHALPRTAAGDIERWKVQEELEHDNR